MQWLQLIIAATREGSGVIEGALLAVGAVTVATVDAADKPIFAPGVGEMPLWELCKIKALFAADSETSQITAQIARMLNGSLQLRWEQLEDKDWSQEWQKYFSPMKCGERLWICTRWIEPPDAIGINLSLDPGLAVGTGSHPTTNHCRRWLDSHNLTAQTVIE